MTTIAARLQAVRSRIATAAAAAGRSPQDIRLIAVSKTFAPAAISEAHGARQTVFGESYVQEAQAKIAVLPPHLEWHFIGPIQSNKTRQIAELFAWAHSVDRLKIAERLSSSRPAGLPPMQICIQVNVSGEESKSGVRAEEALALAKAISVLRGIRLRGLMTIPEPGADMQALKSQFRQVRELKDEIVGYGIALDTLSMGMSDDLEAAIAEGATMVRVGRAIFGQRLPHSG
ncbi:MAG: YggS family pyridoxal phosphate-dependent enzyme [Prolixibacteraceae bacterium]|nr:YggS family pyridoxal phosphate-dependent enzyme [Burkholderiales bacterium]